MNIDLVEKVQAKLFELMWKQKDKIQDKINLLKCILLVHAVILTKGFQCVGLKEDSSQFKSLVPQNWHKPNDCIYSFKYKKNNNYLHIKIIEKESNLIISMTSNIKKIIEDLEAKHSQYDYQNLKKDQEASFISTLQKKIHICFQQQEKKKQQNYSFWNNNYSFLANNQSNNSNIRNQPGNLIGPNNPIFGRILPTPLNYDQNRFMRYDPIDPFDTRQPNFGIQDFQQFDEFGRPIVPNINSNINRNINRNINKNIFNPMNFDPRKFG